jgi:hypothetical protein
MTVNEVGEALMKFLGLIGWVSRMSFPNVLVSRWATTPKLVFCTMCAVGNGPLR